MFTHRTSTIFRGLRPRAARPLVAGALCAALVAATPATAYAESVDDADTVGDMVVYDGHWHPVPVPDRTLNDISNTTLTLGWRRVAIRVDYVDLKKKTGGLAQYHSIHMVTNHGVRRHLHLTAGEGRWSGSTQWWNGNYASIDGPARHSINYKTNLIKVSFPQRCATKHRWLTFKVNSLVESSEGVFEDDALRDRPITADDKRMKTSDRVRPGCVTRREFDQAELDMPRSRVHHIFGTTGALFGERDDAGFSRWYKQCHAPRGYRECRARVDYYYVGEPRATRVAPGRTWEAWCSS